MKLNTYLNFDGDCRAAFEFHAQLLGGNIATMMSFGDSPACDEMPAQSRVEMPIQETLWARRYGITVDRFGVPWMINCEQAA